MKQSFGNLLFNCHFGTTFAIIFCGYSKKYLTSKAHHFCTMTDYLVTVLTSNTCTSLSIMHIDLEQIQNCQNGITFFECASVNT
jgi:hypothetical protein